MTPLASDREPRLPHRVLFLARSAAFVAALASIGLMLSVADFEGPFGRVLALLFAGWVGAPYLLLFHASLRPRIDRLAAWLLLLCSLVVGVLGIATYYDAMYVHLDPQSGIVFFVIPIWQLAGAGLAVWLLARRARGR
jgi:hypothetical protein